MARLARMRSKSGIYHVIVRGINRQNIFQDEEDKGVCDTGTVLLSRSDLLIPYRTG
jgi:hypothetical protein